MKRKATRTRAGKRDLPAGRTAGKVKGGAGAPRAGTVVLPYIEQVAAGPGGGPQVKVFDGGVR